MEVYGLPVDQPDGEPGVMLAFLRSGDSCLIHHELKVWPDVFAEVMAGLRTHEFRREDRRFRTTDVVLLREFVPVGERYTGRVELVEITSLSAGPEWGIPVGYCCFSFRRLPLDRVVGFGPGAAS